jgi:signal transduction histidine kinase
MRLRRPQSLRRLSSVRFRVTLIATFFMAIAFTVASVAIVIAERTTLTSGIKDTAQLRAADVAASIAHNSSIPLATGSREDSLVQVFRNHNDLVTQSSSIEQGVRLSTIDVAPGTSTTRVIEHLPAGDHADYLLVAQSLRQHDDTYTIYVASSLDTVTRSTYILVGMFFVVMPLLVIAVGSMTWIASGRALRPVEAIRRQVEAIESHDLHKRVPEADTGDEINDLARTMNAMLARLQNATERQHRFVSDASHELRSPLAAMRTQLEVELTYQDGRDWKETANDVLDDTLRLQRLVEDLLVLARADASALKMTREPVALHEIVHREIARMTKSTSVGITADIHPITIRGDSRQLERAVGNVLANGLRHATSQVAVTLTVSGDEAVLVVHDDGEGFSDADRERIFERFTRLDDARARDNGGSGLGLAITRELVHAHGGTVKASGTDGGRFVFRFPMSNKNDADVDAACAHDQTDSR